jgi:hypothetical protein
MKKVFLLGLLAFAFAGNPSNADAKASGVLSYQGSLKATNGQAVTKTINMTFAIYNGETSKTPVWSEQNAVNVDNGFFNTYLGKVRPLEFNMTDDMWVEITLDNGEVMPRTRLSAVPYAFKANISTVADTATVAQNVVDGVLTWTKFAADAKKAGGVLTGSYPNPGFNAAGLDDKSIPASKLAPGSALQIVATPGGYAYGDLEGSTFPNLYIAPNKIEGKHIKNLSIESNKLAATGIDKNKVLVADGNGNTIWSDPTEINGIGKARVYGQVSYWGNKVLGTDKDGNAITAPGWKFTKESSPANNQVLAWDEANKEVIWKTQDKFEIPYTNETASSTETNDLIRIKKVSNNNASVLDLEANEQNAGAPVARFTGANTTTNGFVNGVVEINSNANSGANGMVNAKVIGLNVTQKTGEMHGANGSAIGAVVNNTVASVASDAANTMHAGLNVNAEITTNANGVIKGIDVNAKGGKLAVGIDANAQGGAQNIGVLATTGDVTAIDADVNPAIYAVSGNENEPALYVKSPAGANQYAAEIKRTGDNGVGRALYLEGSSKNTQNVDTDNFGPKDKGDKDEAVLVVRNRKLTGEVAPAWATAIGAEGKTAIKAYGDIWANSAVGATTIIGTEKVILGNVAQATTRSEITPNATQGITVKNINTGDVNLAKDANVNLGENGTVNFNGNAIVKATTKANATDPAVVFTLPATGGTILTTTALDLQKAYDNGNVILAAGTKPVTINGLALELAKGVNVATNKFTVAETGNTAIGGTLAVTGNSTLTGTLGVTGATTLTGLTAGASTLASAVVTGNETVGGTLGVTGATTLAGLTAGASTLASAVVTGNETVGGTLGVTGATTLGNTLAVAEKATFTKDIAVGTNAAITGNETVGGTLGVTGATTLGSTLSVADNASFAKDVAVTGNETIGGTLTVAGATTFNGNIQANGTTTIKNLTVTENLAINGTAATLNNSSLNVTSGSIYATGGEVVSSQIRLKSTPGGTTPVASAAQTDKVDLYELAPAVADGDYIRFNGTTKVWEYKNIGDQTITFAAGSDVKAADPTNKLSNLDLQIQANSITTAEIADNAVTASEINAGAVTLAKLAAPAVATANQGYLWNGTAWVNALTKDMDEVAMTTKGAVANWNGTNLVDGAIFESLDAANKTLGIVTVKNVDAPLVPGNNIELNAHTGTVTSSNAVITTKATMLAADVTGNLVVNGTISNTTPNTDVKINDGLNVAGRFIMAFAEAADDAALATQFNNGATVVRLTGNGGNYTIPAAYTSGAGATQGTVIYILNNTTGGVTIGTETLAIGDKGIFIFINGAWERF